MNDADASRLRERDRHLAFGNGIHGRANKRNIERDAACQFGLYVDELWYDFTVLRFEQHVVKGNGDFL